MHQPGITDRLGRSGRFITLAVQNATDAAGTLAGVPALTAQVAALAPGCVLNGTVCLSADLFTRMDQPCPPRLSPFTTLEAGGRRMPGTQADALLHINGDRPDLCFELGHRIVVALGASASVVEDVTGFGYLDDRDLTGFIDGTENPKDEQRAEAALVVGSEDDGGHGSYVLVQRYEHLLERWRALSDPQQEAIIGRTKPDSVELDDKPDNAHISRVVIERDGEELEIVRHSMPYGQADRAGLYFLAYCRDLHTFEQMLANMVGTSADAKHDHLLEFSQAKTGHYFFAPSLAFLERLGS